MSQFRTSAVSFAACVALSLAASSARAVSYANFSLAPLDAGTAYSWYYQGIEVDWENPDGFESYQTVPSDGTTHYAAYVNFQGTAVSTNGHCLELGFSPGSGFFSTQRVQVKVNDHGTNVLANYVDVTGQSGYSTQRIWIHHTTGASLFWSIKLMTPEDGTDWNWASFDFAVKRLELDKAHCTASTVGPWVSFEGSTSSYTFTKGGY